MFLMFQSETHTCTDEEDGYESHAHMYGQHAQSMVSQAHINNSYSYLSVCNVWLTVRASPRATPPSAPISFENRLQLETHIQ